jgi:hypothetical protein
MRQLAVTVLLSVCASAPALAGSVFDALFDLAPRRPASLAAHTAPFERDAKLSFRRNGVRRLLQGDCDTNQTLVGSACVCSPGHYDSKSSPHLLIGGVDSVCLGLDPEGDLATSCELFVNPLETPGVCSVMASASDGFAPYTAVDFSQNGGPRIIPSVVGGPAWLQVDLETPRVVGGVTFRQWLSCLEGSTCEGAFVGFELWVGSNAEAWDAPGNTMCYANTDSARLSPLHDGGAVESPCMGEGRYLYLVMPPADAPGRTTVMPVWHLQVHPPSTCSPSTPCLQCPGGMLSRAGSQALSDCYGAVGVVVNHTIHYAPAALNQSVFDDALPSSIELLGYIEDLEAMLENCPVGYYCPTSTAMPAACPAGTFRDVHGGESVDDCFACLSGHYCPAASRSVVTCPAGTYRSSPGAGQPADCLPCSAGAYCPEASIAPVSCIAGTFRATPSAGSVSDCLFCLPGHHCPAGSVDPTACPAGTSNSRYAVEVPTDCAVCPPGAYCPQASVDPVPCPAGTFLEAAGGLELGACAVCPVGHYCTEGSAEASACDPGTFLGWVGAIQPQECTTCSAGTYCPAASAQPVACPAGTYLDTAGGVQLEDCVACVEGHFCPASSAAPVGCSAGTFRETPGAAASSDCAVCPVGQYCEGAAIVPVGCPAGTYREATGAMTPYDCLVCPVGRYCPFLTATPTNCPAGTFRAATAGVDRSSCESCPAGAYCLEQSDAPVQCPAGTYRAAIEGAGMPDCLVCPAGQYCPEGSAAPASCPAGSFRTDEGATQPLDCVACPAGQFCRVRSVLPVDCPAGSFRALQGATQQLDCAACPSGSYCPLRSVASAACPAGTFRRSQGAVRPEQCVVCPSGMYCPLKTVDPVPCPAGSFRAALGATESAQCVSCPSGGYCPARSAAPTLCAAGFHRDSPRATHLGNCLLCLPGTYAIGVGRDSNCPACPANHYCRIPTLREACPTHTQSPLGSFSILSCVCTPGFACTYYKRVRAISVLNATLEDFNADVGGVRTLFVSAVAAAANVSVNQVVINSVVSAAPASQGNVRRLLSLPPSLDEEFSAIEHETADTEDRAGWAVRRLLAAPEAGIRVFTSVSGALRLARLETRLSRDAGGLLLAHRWEPSHQVRAQRSGTD